MNGSEAKFNVVYLYSVFHRFRQAKFDNAGSILSSSQFSLSLSRLKMKLASKVVKIDSKYTARKQQFKSVKHTEAVSSFSF